MQIKNFFIFVTIILASLICLSRQELSVKNKHEITVGVVVTTGNLDMRMSIQKALVSPLVSEASTVKVKEIIVRDDDSTGSSITDESLQQQTTTAASRRTSKEVTEGYLCSKLLEEGPLPDLVIDTTEKRTPDGETVKKFLQKFGIPSLSMSTGMKEVDRSFRSLGQEKEWLLQINPPVDVISSIAEDLVSEYGLKDGSTALLYDSSFKAVKGKFEEMTRSNPKFKLPAVFLDESPEKMRQILLSTSDFNITNYIVMAGMGSISKLLETAQSVNLLDERIAYYLVTKSRGQLKCPSCRSASILMIQSIPSTNQEYNHTSSLSGVNAENKLDKFFYYDMTRFLIQTVNDLMVSGHWPSLTYPSCETDDSGILPGMTLEQFNERDEMVLGTELSVDGFYGKFGRMVFDDFKESISFQDIVMKVTKVDFLRGQIYPTKTGEWTFGGNHGGFVYGSYQSQGDQTAVADTFPGKKRMRVVIYIQAPFIMKRIINNATHHNYAEYYGYCIDLLNMVRDKMANKSQNNGKSWEWDYDLYEVPDGRFGEKKEDGSWTGIIGELATKKADIGLGPVAVMAERETVVDFTVPYYDLVGINILMKKPAVPSHLFKFLTVLENNVWYSIIGSYFIVSTIIFMYDRISPYSYYNNKEGWADQKRRDFTFKETLWFCMTSLTPQVSLRSKYY